jgi:hypothetical protein
LAGKLIGVEVVVTRTKKQMNLSVILNEVSGHINQIQTALSMPTAQKWNLYDALIFQRPYSHPTQLSILIQLHKMQILPHDYVMSRLIERIPPLQQPGQHAPSFMLPAPITNATQLMPSFNPNSIRSFPPMNIVHAPIPVSGWQTSQTELPSFDGSHGGSTATPSVTDGNVNVNKRHTYEKVPDTPIVEDCDSLKALKVRLQEYLHCDFQGQVMLICSFSSTDKSLVYSKFQCKCNSFVGRLCLDPRRTRGWMEQKAGSNIFHQPLEDQKSLTHLHRVTAKDYLAKNPTASFITVRDHLLNTFKDDPILKMISSNPKLKTQIKDLARNWKKFNNKAPSAMIAAGVSDFVHRTDLISHLTRISYSPRKDFNNLDDFVKALHVSEQHHFFTIPIVVGDFRYYSFSSDDTHAGLSSVIFTCPGLLWNLLLFIRDIPFDASCLHGDAYEDFLKEAQATLITLGTIYVHQSHEKPGTLLKSCRPFGHMIAPGKEKIVYLTIFLSALIRVAGALFGVDLTAKRFFADLSNQMREGIKLVLPDVILIPDYYHLLRSPKEKDSWRSKLNKMSWEELVMFL